MAHLTPKCHQGTMLEPILLVWLQNDSIGAIFGHLAFLESNEPYLLKNGSIAPFLSQMAKFRFKYYNCHFNSFLYI